MSRTKKSAAGHPKKSKLKSTKRAENFTTRTTPHKSCLRTMKRAVNYVFRKRDLAKGERCVRRYTTFLKSVHAEEGEEFDRKYPFLHALITKEMVTEFSKGDREQEYTKILESIQNMEEEKEEMLKIMDSVVKIMWTHFI